MKNMALRSEGAGRFLSGLPNWEQVNRSRITGQPWSLSCFSSVVKGLRLKRPARKIIEVVGSKLKGSLSANLAQCIYAGFNLRVGVFSSPHLISETERISIFEGSLKHISEREFAKISEELMPMITSQSLTYFEALALIAGRYFKNKNLNWAVFEAGLGGRLDATNAYDNDYVVLTPLELEHTRQLGDSLDKIAFEKLSVIKEKTQRVFVWQFSPSQIKAVGAALKKLKVPERKISFVTGQNCLSSAKQIVMEIAQIEGIESAEDMLPESEVMLPGRMQSVAFNNREVVIDVAHTPMSLKYVMAHLNKNINACMFTFARDKSIDALLGMLAERFDRLIFVGLDEPRLIRREEVFLFLRRGKIKRPCYCINENQVVEFLREDMLIVGSFVLAGKALKLFDYNSII